MMNRKGVSLVTVLMFMLVATIAATATFKWLTSEGASSADRMVINEARASAVAGVEAARAWMTYHGNETGAILKQFNDANRNVGTSSVKIPLRLDNVLAPMAKDGQDFTVSIVDVQASGAMATYEVKVVSKGTARNGQAEYTEAAVFAVSGLYQVPVPQPETPAPYHYAYFGGSTSFAGDHHVTSMIINGNWGLEDQTGSNPGHVDNDFIVTGKTVLSGNNIFVGGTGCFGGDLYVDNGLTGNSIYVDGNAKPGVVQGRYSPFYAQGFVAELTGDAYFNGDVTIGNQAKPGFHISGNMSLNGKFTPNLGAFDHSVDGDVCLGDKAAIMFSSNESNDQIVWTVGGNVYMPKSYQLEEKGIANGHGYVRYSNRIFGNKASSRVYIRDAFKCENYYCNHNNMPSGATSTCNSSELEECEPNLSYQIHKDNAGDAKSFSTFRTAGVVDGREYSNPPFTCAKSVKDYCDAIWHPLKKGERACDNAKYKVSDLLIPAAADFEEKALNGKKTGVLDCEGITKISSANTTKMNNCYLKLSGDKELAKRYLYNGYAVFKLTPDQNSSAGADNSSAPRLNGKFIFVFDDKLDNYNPHFPPTASDARAFVYLKKGTGTNAKIDCQPGVTYNYFFYTDANIGGMLGSCTWSGSLYARADSCAKISDINGSVTLKYDADVVNDMYRAKIVCANDGTPCGGAASSSSAANPGSSSSGAGGNAAYDSMYVATGDHLIVSVESEYKSKEKVTNDTMGVKPSMMIFPRVVYLNQDAVGKLSDYYSVIPLNGLKMTGTSTIKADSKLAPPWDGKLVPKKGQNLTKGIYSYTYTYTEAGEKYTSDFYVVVEGTSSETPLVHFVGGAFTSFTQGSPNTADVDLFAAGVSATGQFAVKISVSEILPGWRVTNADGSAVQWQNAADGTKFVVLTRNLSENDTEHKLFKITTTSDATSGTVRFTMQSPQNCILGGGPIVKSFNIKGTATIHRGSLSDYCIKYPEKCAENNDSLKKAVEYEECPDVSEEWVKINCIGASTIIKNDEWTCDAGVGSANVVKLYKGRYETSKCVLYIPEDNNYVDNPKDDKSNPGGYALYASLKRRAYRLKVDTEGIRGSSRVVVGVSETIDGMYNTISPESCADGVCVYVVYAGQYFKAVSHQDGDRISKWICHTCADRTTRTMSGESFMHVVDDDHYITAVYNEKDEHCFYSEFAQTRIWCSSDEIDCINYCAGVKQNCSVLEGHNEYKNPSWVVVNSSGGDDKKPSVTNAGGLYYASSVSGFGLKKQVGDPSVILNSVDGGTEGAFDVRVQTDVVATTKKSSALLNSGIIVRSNSTASEYILVSVFGANLLGTNAAVDAYARVCYVKDVVRKTNDNNCQLAMFKGKNLSISSMGFLASMQLNFTVNVRGDSIAVSGTYVDGLQLYEVIAKVDLKNVVNQGAYTLNDEAHTRVGLKLADAEFKVFDATWNSKKYANECFANPRVFCSFSAKYMDGQVPLNEKVAPVIGYSSWFANEGKNCMDNISYYYNGCDLPANTLGSFFNNGLYCAEGECSDGKVENYLGNNGFDVPDGYYFRCEGAHGFQHATRNGFVRNASVEVNCSRVNGKKFDADCGEFYVGELHNCQQDEEILKTPELGTSARKTIDAPWGTVYNLRDADLIFDLTMEAGKTISVVLEDANRNQSDPFILSQGGENRVPFTKFSNRFGFNPEKVKKIIMTGVGGYTINSIVSRCAYTLKVYCGKNDAMFDGGIWKVKANIQPFESAQKCYVKAENGGVTESWFGDCNEAGEFFLEDPEFLERVNEANGDLQVEFKVAVYDDESATEASEPTSTCVASSQTYKPVSLDCHLAGDQLDFVQGAGIPAFEFNAANCPAAGCEFDAELMGGDKVANYGSDESKASGLVTWAPALNITSPLDPGSYYYHVVLYSDAQKTNILKQCQTTSFKVVEAKPARASDCSVNDGKTFSAYVQGSNYEQVMATLVYTDKLGHPVEDVKTVKVGVDEIISFPLGITEDGEYILTLMLNGEEACSQVYTKGTNVSAIKVECPEEITGQDNGSAISVRPTVQGCEKTDCSYRVNKGSNNSNVNYGGGAFTFYDLNGSGTEEYILTVSKSGTTSDSCKFSVTFVSSDRPSATCSVDKTTVHVGENVKFSVSNMKAISNNFHLEILKGDAHVVNQTDWYYEINYPQNGTDSHTMDTEGTTTFTAKIDGKTVCSQTVTVKAQEQGAYYFTGGQLNQVPPANTTVQITMPANCGGGQLGINLNAASCTVVVNGKSHSLSNWFGQVGASGTFTFNDKSGCVREIRCW